MGPTGLNLFFGVLEAVGPVFFPESVAKVFVPWRRLTSRMA